MTNRDLALCAKRRSTLSPVSGPNAESLGVGMRFFQDGHWWEIDGHINGRATRYYKCKPACDVESRFYTESEIRQALNHQLATMNHSLQDCDDRGTGRFTAEVSRSGYNHLHTTSQGRRPSAIGPSRSATKSDTLKILLVGTRDTVKKAITAFHSIGYASSSEWSPFQVRPNSKEVLSILVQKV